ncbi:hypothetical protein [Streptomyces glebosus]|nr:hypothetical protein [Streptomyces glebosus]
MHFRVLAPLDVRSADGRPAPVPETKVRALLAAPWTPRSPAPGSC